MDGLRFLVYFFLILYDYTGHLVKAGERRSLCLHCTTISLQEGKCIRVAADHPNWKHCHAKSELTINNSTLLLVARIMQSDL